jgi:hypothetical protein
MGQPYIENPHDVFNPLVNPTDWLEIIDSGASPGNAQLSMDGQSAQIVGYIPWNKQRSATQFFLGFAFVDANFILHRANPEAHPVFPWLYASEVNFTPFNPMVNAANPDAPLQFVSPFFGNGLVAINVAFHRLAVCTVRFRNYRYSFLDDEDITDPRMEWMRNVYLDLDPKVEALSADGIAQLAFVETSARVPGPPTIPAGPSIAPGSQQPFPAPVAELMGKATYTLNWVNVPFEYLSNEDDYFFPANILACLGKTNSQNFPFGSSDPFLPGQLLFDSVKFTQKVFPVAALDPSSPLVSVDVSIALHYFNPQKGNQSSNVFGHNLMPWRANGLWYQATRVDQGATPPAASTSTPQMLASTDFNQMFVSPNA